MGTRHSPVWIRHQRAYVSGALWRCISTAPSIVVQKAHAGLVGRLLLLDGYYLLWAIRASTAVAFFSQPP
jgi:hypothetical protein